MGIRVNGKTDVGLRRELNEDSFGILREHRLAVVCDGMGGHAAGEIASRSAVDTVIRLHKTPEYPPEAETAFDLPGDFSSEGRFLASTIRIANSRIHETARARPELSGMGTTVVAAILHNDRISICHVGDSRAYRIKNGVLQQLTQDHSWVNELITAGQLSRDEARDFPNRNVITRALGVRDKVKVDLREDKVSQGDIFLLCTDGLVSCLPDEDILEIVTAGGNDLERTVDDLIAAANSAGGEDNITCVLLQVTDFDEPESDEPSIVAFTFPEESDSELRAQKIVSDMLGETPEEPDTAADRENDRPSDSEQTVRPSGARLFSYVFVAVLALTAIVYSAYAFNLAGAKGVISGWLGLN